MRLRTVTRRRGVSHTPPTWVSDPLTGLLRRRSFTVRAERLLKAMSDAGEVTTLLVVNLDRFRAINDIHGRDLGDLALREAAERIRGMLREEDLLGRLGGDEFAAVLPGTRPEGGYVVGERIAECLRQLYSLGDKEVRLAGSVGMCAVPEDARTFSEAVRCAQVATYEAKLMKHGVSSFGRRAGPHRASAARQEIARAIAHGELQLHYQPIISPRRGAVEIVEALVRWDHPSRGLLAAGVFLPPFEELGVIDAIDEWVVDAAAAQWAAWYNQGIDVAVAVNASACALQQTRYLDWVDAALARYRMPPEALVIEITESATFDDEVTASRMLCGLAARGVRIALDDFGTGYSSLTYARRYPVSLVKIDRSFVHQAHRDARDGRIVGAIRQLAQALDLEVLAEGVEDPLALEWFAERGFDLVQGWAVAHPMSAELAATWIERWRRSEWPLASQAG